MIYLTRMDNLPTRMPVTIEPIQSFPAIKDLVTDVSWNFEIKWRIKPFKPRKPNAQPVCQVLRDHHHHEQVIGPRHLVYAAA